MHEGARGHDLFPSLFLIIVGAFTVALMQQQGMMLVLENEV